MRNTLTLRTSALALAVVGTLFVGQAAASGFQLREQSVKNLGKSSAGSMVGKDAAVVSLNPAAMVNLDKNTFQSDLTMIDLNAKFTGGGSILGNPGAPLSGGNGGDPGDPTLVPNMAAVFPMHGGLEGLTLGVAVGAPFGLATDYDKNWVGRYRALKSDVKTVDLTLSAETEAPIAELAPLLADVAPARLFDESLKLFLAGHGLESLRQLHRLGLLGQLFPATAAALSGPNSVKFGRLLGYTFTSTDERIRNDMPVAPAFLFAAMLWEPVRSLAEKLVADGTDAGVAWTAAVDRILHQQASRVAIPKRFSIAMEEIWSMQSRFDQRQKKRVMRLLAHPRFRAAFDFLVLRSHDEPELKEQVAWWTDAQQLDGEHLSQRIAAASVTRAEGEPGKKRKRSRRRKPHAGSSAKDASVESASE